MVARLSIRQKLLALVLLPLGVVMPLLGALLLWWGDEAFDQLLRAKVRADLAVAQGYFERVQAQVGAGVGAVAESQALLAALARPGADAPAVLAEFKRRHGLDFLQLRGTPWDDSPAAATPDGTARLAVLPAAATGVLDTEQQQRVAVPLVPTPAAAPTGRATEDRALVLLATRPVLDADGHRLGDLQGGLLLNRNLALIDHINEIVYPEGALPFGSQGTVTLFLDDVRISTNVRLFGADGERRAIGTRVSQQVRDEVLGRGRLWLGRAFVVSDWYVSAYEPLADASGRRVGMLYVGLLERPFLRLKYGVLAAIAALFLTAMAGAAVVSLRWARSIFAPIERMESTMRAVEGGALAARVGLLPNDDEIGRLAAHLDELLQTLQQWNAELDAKVAERTRQLEEAQTRLARSERLATVGQLAASIAHEVNNPIAVIQGNLDLVREMLEPRAAQQVAAELKLVDEQVARMRLIVTQLLQFARPGEFGGYVESVRPATAVEGCLVLVSHLLATSGVNVVRELHDTRPVLINRQELQQVMVNLLVNALHAMPGGGTLRLSTRDADGGIVELEVADSGPGLSPERLRDLFQPFATGKKDGTGLGLWISRGIVERYGGDIAVANRAGAVFTVRLKAEGA